MVREREAWDQFLMSGKVEDYLACVGKGEREKDVHKQDNTFIRNDENAGTSRSDRTGAYGISGQ